MRKQFPRKRLLVVSSLLLWGLCFSCRPESFALSPVVMPVAVRPNSADPFLTETRLAEYRKWTRVNPQSVRADVAFATRCASIIPIPPPDPHANTYITVFVNPLAKDAMMNWKLPSFPVGSVIVKQKSPAKNGKEIELFTVMVKRKKGFNPKQGDWEYAVLDGKMAQVQARGKLEKCQGCHQHQAYNDFIFRDAYFSDAQRSRLK